MLTYTDLVQAMVVGRSNGRLRSLPRDMRGLLGAAICFTRYGNVLRRDYVLRRLEPLVGFLMGNRSEPKDGVEQMGSVQGVNDQHSRPAHKLTAQVGRVSRRPTKYHSPLQDPLLRLDHSTSPSENYVILIKKALSQLLDRLSKARMLGHIKRDVKEPIRLVLRLDGIKFASPVLLKALVNSLKKIRLLLSHPTLLAAIGTRWAWSASELAYSWGHAYARNWRRDRGFQEYCGLLEISSNRSAFLSNGEENPVRQLLSEVLNQASLDRIVWKISRRFI